MATIRTAIQIYDGMSRPLQSMHRAMGILLNSFESMQSASSNAIDTAAIREAREELARAGAAFDEIERNIRETEQAQDRFNNRIRDGTSAADGLWSKLKGIAATVGLMAGTKKILDLSDTLSSTTARLNLLVNDGKLDETSEKVKSIEDQNTTIQVNGNNSVANLVDHLSSLEQDKTVSVQISDNGTIGAVEDRLHNIPDQVNTQVTVYDSGSIGSVQDKIQAVEQNRTVAVNASDNGSLEELERKIMVSAQRSRTAYFDTASAVAKLGLNAGSAFGNDMDQVIAFMEQVNKQFVIGGATAQEQSNAMIQLTQAMAAGALRGEELNSILDAAPGIARAIESYMGVAEGSIKQYAEQGLVTAEVVKTAIFETAGETNAAFESMPMTWAQVFTIASNIAIQILKPLLLAINWLANNISIIGPIVMGLGVAFAVFQIATHWTQIAAAATAIYHGVVNFLSIGFGVLTGNTAAASAAVFTFNSALLANPIVWLVMLIAMLIAVLYAGVAAYNNFADAGVSATGILAGAFAVMGAQIINTSIIPLQNAFAMFANFIGNVFNDPVAALKVLFYDFCLTVFGYIKNLVSGIEDLINKIPGVAVDITSGLDKFYAGLEQAQQKVKDESGWVEYVKKMDFIDYSDAASAGYKFGEGIANKIFGVFTPNGLDPFDFGNSLDGIYNNTGDTAGNTAAMNDTLNIAEEDLEYMRDIAEREAINRYITAQIKVEQHNENHISKDSDLDGIMDMWVNDFAEKLDISGEGVHE